MNITKLIAIACLSLLVTNQSLGQDVSKKEKKIIRIESTEDLAALDEIFAPNQKITRSTASEEEETLASLATMYTVAQAEQDALDKEQKQLVDWYFDSPQTINQKDLEVSPKKKEVIPFKK